MFNLCYDGSPPYHTCYHTCFVCVFTHINCFQKRNCSCWSEVSNFFANLFVPKKCIRIPKLGDFRRWKVCNSITYSNNVLYSLFTNLYLYWELLLPMKPLGIKDPLTNFQVIKHEIVQTGNVADIIGYRCCPTVTRRAACLKRQPPTW